MIRSTTLAVLFAAAFAANAAEPAAAKADPEKAKPIVESVCLACHGTDGNSTVSPNPNIAGQFPEYIYKQLREFKPDGDKPAIRDNPIMGGMASPLSDEDMRNLAAYFSQQKLKPAEAKDEKLLAAGKKLWRMGNFQKGIPACAGCHGPNGAGIPAQYPHLAGQVQEYTESQLQSFRNGTRKNDPEQMMQMIAGKLSDAEIKALSEYIAGLR